ncbi:glycine-rich protein [Brevibacillus laterosporus]|uniref:glycine rich domain-containing protein n=1 Tax=Brevibacillus laterosporus TaxID=1465 RepID=UPI003D221445
MSTGIVIFCDGEAVRSDTGGIKQYANGFTVNKDFILHTVEAKISNPFSSSENATITLWDDTGNLIAQKTKLISENLSPAWVSFEFTPVKLIAGREYVVGMTSLGVRLWLDNENLPKIIKSNTVGFDFTIKNHRNRFSDTYTSAPPVDKYQHINDFKLIGDFNSAPTMTLTSNNQSLTENQRINIGTNDFTVNITANDADPDDTLQYQIKLNNVVKKDWTAISKNHPVNYTFKNADNVNNSNPFIVRVRDNNGAITTFEATLVKHEQPKYLGSVYLGTLRNKTTVIPRPMRPWRSYREPYEGAGSGNIASFKTDPVITNWNIGDTDATLDNQLHWHKIIDGSKTLLICDRVILADITWNDLNSDNRIFGKTITIDGRQFKLRVLNAGNYFRQYYGNGDWNDGGDPTDNEWDRFITNEDAISGIPSPVKSDLDDLPLSSTDKYSSHNIFWNWMGIYSWGQEEAFNGGNACRGNHSARFWRNGFSNSRYDDYGWRPVLEVLNQPPKLTLTANNQSLTENQRINIGTNDFTVNITANDADPDDTLQYQVKLNNVVKQAWTALGKNQPVSYTFKNADITAGVIPFTVSVRDDKGNQTDFNVELTKGKIGKDAQGRTTYTFEYTGKPEVFMVPPNVTKLKLEAWGAEGGKGKRGDQPQYQGGLGGYVQGEWKSLNQDILTIYVGGEGKDSIGSSGGSGGFNGGGNGGDGFYSTYSGGGGGGGGGASDIRVGGTSLVNRLIVAAGGGGSSSTSNEKYTWGYGGGLTGGNGFGGGPQAGGGTQATGGIGGEYASFEGENGELGVGGDGAKINRSTGNPFPGGGGGGAGYYGGGGGGYACSGGGGSSYYGNLANGSTTAGVREGNGLVVITLLNEPPKCTITSPPNNQTLTENATLNIQGTASDTDKDNVVTIKYRINNGTTRALQSGVSNGSTPISFAKTLTFRAKRLYDGTTDLTGSNLAENTDHTLTIWAEDDQGGKSTEVTRKFRVVHNRPPVINGQNVDLGVLNAIPSKTYTVTEPERDAFTITEKINGKVIRTFAGTDSKENTATIPLDTWLRLSLTAVHTLTIEATDSKGMTSTRSYTFRRSADKIAFALRNPFGTDIAAKRILVTIDATIPAGADYKAEVCNNAFDELPTWEDASNHVKFNRGFIFTNKEKTAEKWGVSVRFSFTKGIATEPIIVRGFGGAFD